MKYISLLIKMLRIKASLTILIFLSMGAIVGGVNQIDIFIFLYSAFAMLAIYGFAVCLNDIADVKIDRINLKGATDRPLISRDLRPKGLVVLSLIYLFISLLFSSLVGSEALLLIIASAVLSIMYSLKPFSISHRPILSIVLLSFCYSTIPLLMGLSISDVNIVFGNHLLLIFAYCIIASRIFLKDFRDRIGDSMYGKVTFLLKYDKKKTLFYSNLILYIGLLLFVILEYRNVVLVLALIPFIVMAVISRAELFETGNYRGELCAISKDMLVVNGMLIMITGYLLINSKSLDIFSEIIFCLTMIVLYLYNFKSVSFNS